MTCHIVTHQFIGKDKHYYQYLQILEQLFFFCTYPFSRLVQSDFSLDLWSLATERDARNPAASSISISNAKKNTCQPHLEMLIFGAFILSP